MKSILIYVGVQDVSLGSPCLFKEGICAGDADVALWEFGHLRVFQDNSQRTPLHLTIDCITAVRIGVTQSPWVCWPSCCVWAQVTLEAATSNLSIHSSQEESWNGRAKWDTVVYQRIISMQSVLTQCWVISHPFTSEWPHKDCQARRVFKFQ